MSEDASSLVHDIMRSVVRADVPPLLLERLEQQRANLQDLALALIEGGMDEAGTRAVVSSALDSFKSELSRTIMLLKVTENAD